MVFFPLFLKVKTVRYNKHTSHWCSLLQLFQMSGAKGIFHFFFSFLNAICSFLFCIINITMNFVTLLKPAVYSDRTAIFCINNTYNYYLTCIRIGIYLCKY